jgi:hypothetical protein
MADGTATAGTISSITTSAPTAIGGCKLAIANDICAPYPNYNVPVNFDCALACTSIGWPMQMGVLLLNFFADDETCPDVSPYISKYVPMPNLAIGLACKPGNPSPEGIWIGETFSSAELIPGYGMSFRYRATMTVEAGGGITVTVQMDRLVPNSEFVPPPSGGENVYVACGSFSAFLTRSIPAGTDILDRNITWSMTHAGLLPFVPGGAGSYCETDIKSFTAAVLLFPYKLGCTGTAENGPAADCSLSTGYRTFSCMGLLVEPITAGGFPAQWVQMGVNFTPSPLGCRNGHNSGTLESPPIAAYLTPGTADLELLNCGCPGEDPLHSDSQQIQFGTAAGYDVVLKSVNKSEPCLALRLSGAGNPWTVGTYTINSTILAESGHWVITASFPAVAGAPKVVLYGMEFPSGVLAECVPIPIEGMQPMAFGGPPLAPEPPKQPSPARIMADKMRAVKTNPCVNLGMALETAASCGCGGGILHGCSIHGKCRQAGNDQTVALCWKCPDYLGSR